MNNIEWKKTCCAWHGEYAEHPAKDGGVLRLKRAPNLDGYLAMHFINGTCKTVDADGVPQYVNISESELMELI